jgi:hypothetical protein
MSRHIIILKPRLDVPFKNLGPVPTHRGPITPLRKHWVNVIEFLKFKHECFAERVTVYEKPLWQFTPELVKSLDANTIYVPHHCRKTFDPNGEMTNVIYYMQMVFPYLFQVDRIGWCADASVWPIQPQEKYDPNTFVQLQKEAMSGVSKMDQPSMDVINPFQDYIFFPCQLPHDQTITLHSDVTVPEALQRTIDFAKKVHKHILIKPHPANPGSMAPLYEIYKNCGYEKAHWVDRYNIHSCIQQSAAVFSVNSGVGMESLLHNKPVFCYGRADYAAVSHFVDDSLDEKWENRDMYIPQYAAFIDAYVNKMIRV